MIVCPLALADFSDAEEATVSYTDISAADFLALADNGVIDLGDKNYSITGNTITIDENLTIKGNGSNYLHAFLKMDATLDEGDSKTLTVNVEGIILDGNGYTVKNQYPCIGIHSQNQGSKNVEATSVRQLDLTVKDCTVQNFEGKGMYITNEQKVTVEGCTFNNVGGSQETINYGDHAIDLCIGGVENAEIRIVGNTFVGMSGQNTCIQIQQRNPNGSTDDNPGDWWGFDVDTSIKSAYIAGNDFTQSKSPADVRLGSWPKAGDERTFTKAFPATIVAETATKVVSCTELGGNGNNSPLQDMNVELNVGAEFSVDGAYGYEAKKTTLDYNLESGVATLSGYVPEYMTVNVAEGATAVAIGLENHGTVNSIDGNVIGTPVDGDPVTDVTPSEPEDPDTPGTDPTPDAPADEPKNDTMTFVAAIAVIVVIVLLVVMIADRRA